MREARMTRQQALEQLCAPGQPFELQTREVLGRSCRVLVNAPLTLRDVCEQARSDLDFVVYQDERLSFEDVYQKASELASAMVNRYGISKGDRVAIAMRNYPEWVISFLAATSIGAIAVAINAWWNARELDYGLQDCGAALAIVDLERLDRLSRCRNVPDGMQVVRVRTEPKPGVASDLWEEVLGAHAGHSMPAVELGPDDDATIIFTSGSTGHPKGVLSTHRMVIHALMSWELDWAVREQTGMYVPAEPELTPCKLLAIPFFHVAGSHAAMLSAMRSQSRLVCMYKWDVDVGMELIERERVTVFTATPSVSGDIVHAAKTSTRDISSLRVMGGGGASRPPEQVLAIDNLSEQIVPHTGWGMTEINAIGTSNAAGDYLNHPGSPGQCSAVLDLRVIDEESEECPPGEPGELQVRGTTLFRGYWNRPEATAESFDGDWFCTGDMAYISEDGFLYIVDRIKDLVNRGGENVGCGGVEAALQEHPDVIEACVYGVPDQRLGEEVGTTLFVNRILDEQELREFLGERLAHFEVPRYYHQQTEILPRTASGKLYKKQLRSEAIERLGLG